MTFSPDGRFLAVDFQLPTTFLGKSFLTLILHGGLHVGIAELPEILAMSDRVLVMREGRLTGQLPRAEATQEKIMAAATAHKAVGVAA